MFETPIYPIHRAINEDGFAARQIEEAYNNRLSLEKFDALLRAGKLKVGLNGHSGTWKTTLGEKLTGNGGAYDFTDVDIVLKRRMQHIDVSSESYITRNLIARAVRKVLEEQIFKKAKTKRSLVQGAYEHGVDLNKALEALGEARNNDNTRVVSQLEEVLGAREDEAEDKFAFDKCLADATLAYEHDEEFAEWWDELEARLLSETVYDDPRYDIKTGYPTSNGMDGEKSIIIGRPGSNMIHSLRTILDQMEVLNVLLTHKKSPARFKTSVAHAVNKPIKLPEHPTRRELLTLDELFKLRERTLECMCPVILDSSDYGELPGDDPKVASEGFNEMLRKQLPKKADLSRLITFGAEVNQLLDSN